jgi:O-antigen ligase
MLGDALNPPSGFPWQAVLALAVLGGTILIVSAMDVGILLPAAMAAMMYVVWSFRRPVAAVATIIVLYLHLLNKDEGITPAELAFVLYAFGYLAFWFMKTTFIERRRILKSPADFCLAAFVGIGCVSVVMTLAWGGSLFVWLREFMTVAQLLLYFPVRDAMKSRKDAAWILVAAVSVIGFVALYSLANYRSASLAVKYVWELISSRKSFGDHLFFPVTVVMMSLVIHARTARAQLLLSLVLLVFGLALAQTFSRGFWIATAFGFFLLFVVSGPRARARIVVVTTTMLAIAATVVLTFIGSIGGSVLTAMVSRVTSAGSALTDKSVTNRFAESQALMDLIPQSPFVGHGIGTSFSFYNIIDEFTMETGYAHNGYLFLLYKVGILGTVALVGFFIAQMATALRISRSGEKDSYVVPVARGVGAVLAAMLLVTVTSNVFIQKQSLEMIIIGTAFLGSAAALPRPTHS